MIVNILAQASQGSGWSSLILFGGIAIVFYFFMIRPQQKKQKQQKQFIEELKKGDTVVTIGGIHGKIVDQNETSVTLDIDRGTKIKFEKTSISLESSKQYQ